MKRYALTPKEAADLLGVSLATIYRAMKREELAYEVVSGRKLIPARALTVRFGEPVEIDVEAA